MFRRPRLISWILISLLLVKNCPPSSVHAHTNAQHTHTHTPGAPHQEEDGRQKMVAKNNIKQFIFNLRNSIILLNMYYSLYTAVNINASNIIIVGKGTNFLSKLQDKPWNGKPGNTIDHGLDPAPKFAPVFVCSL